MESNFRDGVKNGLMGIRTGATTVKMWRLILILALTVFTGAGCLQESASVPRYEVGVLIITGDGVAEEVRLTMDELKAMEQGVVEDDYFALNSYGTESYTRFKGVWLWHVLQQCVELQDTASTVRFIAADGYQVELTLNDVKRDDYIDQNDPAKRHKMILAWEADGVAFHAEEGNPLQLVIGQREPGDVNKPYWVRHIQVIVIE